MSIYDFATVRLFEDVAGYRIFFMRSDEATKATVKSMKGRWDPNARCWSVEEKWSRKSKAEIVAEIEKSLIASAPESWQKKYKSLSRLTATTKRFEIRIEAGGMRIGLPKGHKHEYTFQKISDAIKQQNDWYIPSFAAESEEINKILADAISDDREALFKALNYLEGFYFEGNMTFAQGEADEIGFNSEDKIVYAQPIFIQTVDTAIQKEPIYEYPLKVLGLKQVDANNAIARLQVVTGNQGWMCVRKRLAQPIEARTKLLDERNILGRWQRGRL